MVKRSQKTQEVITRAAKRPAHGQCYRDGLLLIEYILWLEAELEAAQSRPQVTTLHGPMKPV